MRMFNLLKFHYVGRDNTRRARVVAAALSLIAMPAMADDSQCLLGTWKGTLTGPIGEEVVITPVTVVLSSLEEHPHDFNSDVTLDPDKPRQQIIFAAPLRCRLSLAFAGPHTDKKGLHYHLTLIDPNGGKCEHLENVQIRLQCTSDKSKLKAWYSYSKADKSTASEVFELAKVPPT